MEKPFAWLCEEDVRWISRFGGTVETYGIIADPRPKYTQKVVLWVMGQSPGCEA
jgi:hypothetical protein